MITILGIHSARRIAVAGLVVVMLVAGCGGQDSVPAPGLPTLDPPVHYTTQWTAPENVDLFSRAAELVRVSVESGDYAMAFGVTGLYQDYPPFPGYLRAIGAPASGSAHYTDAYYASPFPQADTVEGAKYYHLVQLTTDGRNIDAIACGYEIRADELSLAPLNDAVHVQMSTTVSTPGLPGIPDAHADSRDPRAHVLPSWNVFGDWKIDTMIHSGFDERDTFSGVCFAWWVEHFPTFILKTGSPYLYPPKEYSYPTVPPDHRQYPEWIGPADPS